MPRLALVTLVTELKGTMWTEPSPARSRTARFLRRRASSKAGELRKEWLEVFDAPGRERWWIEYLARNARAGKPGL